MAHFFRYAFKYSRLAALSILFISWSVFANSDPITNPTRIDCQSWDDSEAAPFDSSKTPYFSLKRGIEDSVRYLNDNSYTNGSNPAYHWKGYVILVSWTCHYTQQDWGVIVLDFDGVTGRNSLHIASENENQSFGIINQSFLLTRQTAGNIIFENVGFLKNDVSRVYFDGFWLGAGCGHPWQAQNGPWITIRNSVVNVSPGAQLSRSVDSTMANCYWWVSHLQGGYQIENSTFNYYVNGHSDMRNPVIIKDSKINIKNANLDGAKYDVYFSVAWRDGEWYKYGSSTIMSSVIDMNGNNFRTHDYSTIFVNDSFLNVWQFTAGNANIARRNIFVNNTVQSSNQVEMGYNDIAYNNIFSAGFTDSWDFENFKRNFSGTSTDQKGVGWIYRKLTGWPIKVSLDYKTLYEQLHPGQTIEEWPNPIYLVIE